jgi:hypothetical protein
MHSRLGCVCRSGTLARFRNTRSPDTQFGLAAQTAKVHLDDSMRVEQCCFSRLRQANPSCPREQMHPAATGARQPQRFKLGVFNRAGDPAQGGHRTRGIAPLAWARGRWEKETLRSVTHCAVGHNRKLKGLGLSELFVGHLGVLQVSPNHVRLAQVRAV